MLEILALWLLEILQEQVWGRMNTTMIKFESSWNPVSSYQLNEIINYVLLHHTFTQ